MSDIGDILAKAFTLGYETGRKYALFTATEPAEDAVGDPLQAWKEFLKPKPIGWYSTMTREFATEHFGFPEVTGLLECTHTASDGGTWGWCGGDWELRYYPPAPAEPAEEETKARCLSRWDELRCGLAVGHAGSHEQGKCSDPDWAIWPGDHANPTTSAEHIEEEAMLAARGEGWYEGYEVGLEYGPIAASGEEYDGPINPYDVPASSPVVPAPTEASVIGGAAIALRAALDVVDPLEDGDWEHAWRTVEDLEDCASRAEAIVTTEPGPWPMLNAIPADVCKVRDREGDIWERTKSGWWKYRLTESGLWHESHPAIDYSCFAPFTATGGAS